MGLGSILIAVVKFLLKSVLFDFCKSSSTTIEGSGFYVKESMVYVCVVECFDGFGMFR